VQGERPLVIDNKSLGNFTLDGIPPAPRGIPHVEVTFDIDANGILKVTALDRATGRSQHITLTASSGLSPAEIERMRQEAEVHADEDRKRRDEIELRNQADNALHAAENVLGQQGASIPAEGKTELQTAISTLKDALAKDNLETIRVQTEALSQAVQRIGTSPHGSGSHDPNSTSNPFAEDSMDGKTKIL